MTYILVICHVRSVASADKSLWFPTVIRWTNHKGGWHCTGQFQGSKKFKALEQFFFTLFPPAWWLYYYHNYSSTQCHWNQRNLSRHRQQPNHDSNHRWNWTDLTPLCQNRALRWKMMSWRIRITAYHTSTATLKIPTGCRMFTDYD